MVRTIMKKKTLTIEMFLIILPFSHMDGFDDALPQYKLTCYTVYDKEGHVVPFDTGIIDKNKLIYFSGYLKHLTCEDPSIEDGVPVFDCGPINAWSNAGFDGGEKALTIFSTGFAEYYLMEPSEAYQPFARQVEEKVFLAKQANPQLELSGMFFSLLFILTQSKKRTPQFQKKWPFTEK